MTKLNKPVIFEDKHGASEIVHASGSFFTHRGGGLEINWGATNCGFGQVVFHYDNESGKIVVDSETMNREFITKVMEKMIQESIFSDYEQLVKEVKEVNLVEINAAFNFQPNVIQSAFYSEESEDGTSVQMRWHLKDNKVLNVWFAPDKVKEAEEREPYFGLSMDITTNQTFIEVFQKAEIWSWKTIEK